MSTTTKASAHGQLINTWSEFIKPTWKKMKW